MTGWRLVADVGGSNARFAKATDEHQLYEKRCLQVADHESFYLALKTYLDLTGGLRGCHSAAIAAAGPVDGTRVQLTNAAWSIDSTQVSPIIDGAPAGLVNDLRAVALALPHLTEADVKPLRGGPQTPMLGQTRLAFNVGTGCGGAAAIPVVSSSNSHAPETQWVAAPGEPGHMSLIDPDLGRCGFNEGTTVEDILSGRGVMALYRAIAQNRGLPFDADATAAEIFLRCTRDDSCAETVKLFSKLLGRVVGDAALTTAAWGGAFLTGSVINGWENVCQHEDFRESFDSKGLLSGRMQNIFVGIITQEDVALLGLSHLKH